MKLTFLLVGLLSGVQIGLHAQSSSVEWGPSYPVKGTPAEPPQLIVPESDQYYYLKTGGRRKGILARFSTQHQLLATEVLETQIEGERPRAPQFVRTANDHYAFWTQRDKKASYLRGYVSTLRGGALSTARQVYERQFDCSLLPSGPEGERAPTLFTSNDGKLVALFSPLGDRETGGTQQLAVAVFDANWQLHWDRQVAFPYADRDVNFERVVLNDAGEVLVLVRLYEGPRRVDLPLEGREDPRPFDYRVFRLTAEGPVEYEISLEAGRVPTDAGLFLPPGKPDQFLVVGFYREVDRANVPRGLFWAQGQRHEQDLRISSHPIERDFWMDLPSYHPVRKQWPTSRALTFDRLIEFPDGTYGLVGADTYTTIRTGGDGFDGVERRVRYHWGPIFLARFDAAGKGLGIHTIHRDDYGEAPLAPSYALVGDGERHWLVFNDRLTRDERQARMVAEGQRSGKVDLKMVSIDGKGQIGPPQRLAPGRDPDLVFHPRLFALRNGTLLLGKVSHVKYAFGSLELD